MTRETEEDMAGILVNIMQATARTELLHLLKMLDAGGNKMTKLAVVRGGTPSGTALEMLNAFKALITVSIREVDKVDAEDIAKQAVVMSNQSTETKQ